MDLGQHTVNDKSFEGEKFCGLLGSSGMFHDFFHHHLHTCLNFQRRKKFSRENFHGLIKIRENRESFLTVKLLSFTVDVLYREFILNFGCPF